jgi:uncharacterized protein (DUF1684 family)
MIAALAAAQPGSPARPPRWGGQSNDYRAEIERRRRDREARLLGDDSWLTVAGLFFLKEGTNAFGSSLLNDIVLPDAAPPDAGVFEFQKGDVVVRAAKDGTVTVNNVPVERAALRPASAGRPADRVKLGPLTLFVHRSGGRTAIRLRDQNSALRREFSGLRWFPINEKYRVRGQFVPYASPRMVTIQNILGDIEPAPASGYVVFSLEGAEHRLVPLDDGDTLWFIFRDLTSGTATYPAARFLYAELPKNGEVTLDFNKAENPPCAFNPYTTCPLPPPENRLRARIEAGEMTYKTSQGLRP